MINVIERALEAGSAEELIGLLHDIVAEQVEHRLDLALVRKLSAVEGVTEAWERLEAMLGPQVWWHELYLAALAPAHGGEHHHR